MPLPAPDYTEQLKNLTIDELIILAKHLKIILDICHMADFPIKTLTALHVDILQLADPDIPKQALGIFDKLNRLTEKANAERN